MLTFSQFGIPFRKVVHGLCGRADQLRDEAVCNEDRALCLTVAGFPEWFFRRNVEPDGAQGNPQGCQHWAEIWEICVACVNDLLAVVTVLKVSLCKWLLL